MADDTREILAKISADTGHIKDSVTAIAETVKDHETRIRGLETSMPSKWDTGSVIKVLGLITAVAGVVALIV